MKILSFKLNGEVKFGTKVKKEEAVWDVLAIQEQLQALPSFPNTIIEGISLGFDFVEKVRRLVEAAQNSPQVNDFKIPFTEIEWLAPIPRTPKNILCVGKNYDAHAKEMGAEAAPSDLLVFTKPPTSISADEQTLSVHATKTDSYDYEGELAVVIGKFGRDIPKNQALDYVFGYTIANDLTARDVQDRHKQFFLGKSLDGSCPMGPYVVTKDEIPDPQVLTVVTKVNGEIRQNGSTKDMIFTVENLISIISHHVTLEPGDIILTGTPAGVGKGMNPPTFLKAGDEVKVSIEGIGTLVNRFQ
ncbi:2-keto-4-pentenoate hydratase/2-oxohepta-3-ene-1,7-dioic acid hydratase in catechol pathway [Lysinibacillus composti]|uniref:FAA hydrolase family protein n=1 Tax=Lysinibacillus composti TaxID=720633 RepID=A0A3N9UU16_9BACI|nr:fumarylacetoacetate hydrolase family protein [Lysinibacillus composti]MBM7607932.1 2-keto-4-pentenoate hydratase/2-oxohepta-3-ene-1,7-dioic acid hydratase in catechol pathway [Lysinibacillus composti]RQW75396.1 FAA hydrolase family protein [Lysinibacillus composti]